MKPNLRTIPSMSLALALAACLTCCSADVPKYAVSADGSQLLATSDVAPLKKTIRLDQAVRIGNGNQTTSLYYDANQRRLYVLVPIAPNVFQLADSYVFDDAVAPTGISSAYAVGSKTVVVQLHVDPTNSWFVLCNQNTKQVRSYFASNFACDEPGSQIAYIAGQPHFGSGPATVYVNGRAAALLTARNYWQIRWDKQLSGFILFNEQQEKICLCGSSGKGLAD